MSRPIDDADDLSRFREISARSAAALAPSPTPAAPDSGEAPEAKDEAKDEAPRSRLAHFRSMALNACILTAAFYAPALLSTGSAFLDRIAAAREYAQAEPILQEAKSLGFSSSEIAWGSPRLSSVLIRTASHAKAAVFGDGRAGTHSAHAVSVIEQPGIRSPGVPSCSVSLDPDSAKSPLLVGGADSLRFTALHEATHCHTYFTPWLSLSPSPSLLSPEERLSLSALLSAGVSESGDSEPGMRDAFKLLVESASDARALAIMASTLPRERWLTAGWEAWITRSLPVSKSGQVDDHATSVALGLILSIDPASLERLTARQSEFVAAQAASDGMLLELSRQGWHQAIALDPRGAAERAAASAERLLESLPETREEFQSGAAVSVFGGERGLRRSISLLRSPQGPAAMASLARRMDALRSAPLPLSLRYSAERDGSGPALSASVAPNLGFADLSSRDSLPDGAGPEATSRVLATSVAFLIARAQSEYSGFRPQTPLISALGRFSEDILLPEPARSRMAASLAPEGSARSFSGITGLELFRAAADRSPAEEIERLSSRKPSA